MDRSRLYWKFGVTCEIQQWLETKLTHFDSTAGPQPALSPAQLREGATWQRALSGPMTKTESFSGNKIVQDNVDDCSLVAALIVGANHHRKFGSKARSRRPVPDVLKTVDADASECTVGGFVPVSAGRGGNASQESWWDPLCETACQWRVAICESAGRIRLRGSIEGSSVPGWCVYSNKHVLKYRFVEEIPCSHRRLPPDGPDWSHPERWHHGPRSDLAVTGREGCASYVHQGRCKN